MKRIYKSELARDVADRIGISKGKVEKVITAVIQAIRDDLRDGNEVVLSGLCRFYSAKHPVRNVTNPRTGELIVIPEQMEYRCHVASKSLRR